MKVLIWIGYLIAGTIISRITDSIISLIPVTGNTDVLLSSLINGTITALIQGGAIWLAIKHCKRLDWYRAMKKANEAGMTLSEYGRLGLSEAFLAKLEEMCNTLPFEQVKPQLKACMKKGKITKEQYIILLEEYCKAK